MDSQLDRALADLRGALDNAAMCGDPEIAVRAAASWAEESGTFSRIERGARDAVAAAPSRMVRQAPEFSARLCRAAARELRANDEVRSLLAGYMETAPRTSAEAENHDLATRVLIFAAIMRSQDPTWNLGSARSVTGRRLIGSYLASSRALFGDEFLSRAFDTSDVSEWVPTGTSSQLIRFYEVSGSVLPNLVQLALTRGTQRWPFQTAPAPSIGPADMASARVFNELGTLGSGGENWSAAPLYPLGNAPADAAVFSRVKFRAPIILTGDFSEEAAVAAVDTAGAMVGAELRRGVEDCTINGATATGGGFDTDHSTATAGDGTTRPRVAWNGFRRTILTNTATTTGPCGTNGPVVMSAAFKKMTQRYQTWYPDLMLITSGRGLLDLMLGQTNGSWTPVSSLGPRADLPLGTVGTYCGVGVVLSDFVRTNLNATGYYDGAIVDNTVHVIVNRSAWALGTFLPVSIEPSRMPMWDHNAIIGWWSGDVKKVVASGDISEAAIVDVPN